MEKASFCKAHRNLMIGLLAALAPLATLHAADDEPQWRQSQADAPSTMPGQTPDTGSGSGQYDRDRTLSPDERIEQEPTRSGTIDQDSEYTREMQRRRETDRQMERQRDRDGSRRVTPEGTQSIPFVQPSSPNLP